VFDDVAKALFALFDYFPLAQVLSWSALVLICVLLCYNQAPGGIQSGVWRH
jgi:choline-glycine betaine transporter